MFINKPQFDLDVIKISDAYWLKKRGTYNIDGPSIVINISPLSIELTYYNHSHKKMDNIILDINDIVKQYYILTPLTKFIAIEQEVKSHGPGNAEDKEMF